MIGNKKSGFTIFFAMLVGSLALAVGLSIYDLTTREIDLSSAATQSQYAIYAADSGAECALYWDSKAPLLNGATSAFGTSTAASWATSGITCNSQDVAAAGTPPATWGLPPTNWTAWNTSQKNASAATTTFTVVLDSSIMSPCAFVEVGKYSSAGILYTTVLSHGYNSCSPGVSPRLERELQVSY